MYNTTKRIWRKVLVLFWSITVPRLVRARGVQLGKGVRFYGNPIIELVKGSTVSISDGAVLCSDSRFTALGVSHPVIIRTLSAHAEIHIGAESGLSGTTICAAHSVNIGRQCLVGADVLIFDTDFHPKRPENRRHNNNPADISTKPVWIGDNVFIGTRSIIGKGAVVGTNSVIGSGSNVVGELKENSISVGNPARCIGII